MKAQINTEFLISMMTIGIVLMFILTSISNNLPRLKAISRDIQRDMKANIISQIFLFDKYVGFNQEIYELNESKINDFATLCSDYENVRKDFGYIAVSIVDFDGNIYLDCKPYVGSTISSKVIRFALLNNKIVKVVVEVFE